MRRASCRSVPITCRPPSSRRLRPFFFHFFALVDFLDQGVPFGGRNIEPRGIFILQNGPRHRFGIAAENDVGAAAGHIGGDRHGAFAARLGDDFCLALVMLGVKHLVRNAARSNSADTRSLFSIETVPTRIGRPRSIRRFCRANYLALFAFFSCSSIGVAFPVDRADVSSPSFV